MKRPLILTVMATLAMPVVAQAQSAPTAEDEMTALKATNADLLNLVNVLRAQLAADIRERGELLKKVGGAEKDKVPPTTPPNAPSKQ